MVLSKNHFSMNKAIKCFGIDISRLVFDATGVKLSKKVVQNGVNGPSETSTDYDGNFIYKNGNLEFFSHPEGYIEPTASITAISNFNKSSGSPYQTNYNYVYQYKDHLGNIRLFYSDSDKNGSTNANTEIIE
jgi:hypothetical protein